LKESQFSASHLKLALEQIGQQEAMIESLKRQLKSFENLLASKDLEAKSLQKIIAAEKDSI